MKNHIGKPALPWVGQVPHLAVAGTQVQVLAPPLTELGSYFTSLWLIFICKIVIKSNQPLKPSVRLEEVNTTFQIMSGSGKLSIGGLLAHMAPL